MLKFKTFVFNPFQVNTYVLYDDTKECIIIDPACYENHEVDVLVEFIKKDGLIPKMVINTHCHIDHILGNNFILKKYRIPFKIHKDSVVFIDTAKSYANIFGFEIEDQLKPDEFLEENDKIEFGKQKFEVIHTPGHADGSLCFYHQEEGVLFSGDVLFKNSIGRTDLPTGNYEKLIKSITEKLLILPEEVIVYPGHGPETTIREEKKSNPFLNEN